MSFFDKIKDVTYVVNRPEQFLHRGSIEILVALSLKSVHSTTTCLTVSGHWQVVHSGRVLFLECTRKLIKVHFCWPTCGAYIRFISSSLVCSGPSAGRLFFRASSRNAVHGWIMFVSMKTSTICVVTSSAPLTLLQATAGFPLKFKNEIPWLFPDYVSNYSLTRCRYYY